MKDGMEINETVCLVEIAAGLHEMLKANRTTGAGIIALVHGVAFLDEYYKTHDGYRDMLVDLADDEADILYVTRFVVSRLNKAMEEIRKESKDENINKHHD